MTPNKTFYSVLENACVKAVPQPIQHLVNGQMAARQGGEVTYYTAEDTYTRVSQELVTQKVREKPRVNGFIFFTLAQFCHGSRPNIPLLEWILKQGYEIHFAKESLSLRRAADLEENFPFISVYFFSEHRDRRPAS